MNSEMAYEHSSLVSPKVNTFCQERKVREGGISQCWVKIYLKI